MLFYKDPDSGQIHAYREETVDQYLQPGLVAISDSEYQEFIDQQALTVSKGEEGLWVAAQLREAAEQILMLDDDDPAAMPGTTVADWRGYRVALRAWKDGAEGFPGRQYRPRRPQ
ncbi:hypothetical protein LOY42_20105 [Pseudomonas sp. B21-023]|uniref:hypothetical protein n=1 Tax=Pseudomonas sp. B21-023 TaxID=2895477 RepID=UPI00215F1118|nr:hypothetical protein [Pseudomonas sp. B21-023]UVM15553.1 hypothetical protein LOY42_20105 [Pseudomonas sp. B21-023]